MGTPSWRCKRSSYYFVSINYVTLNKWTLLFIIIVVYYKVLFHIFLTMNNSVLSHRLVYFYMSVVLILYCVKARRGQVFSLISQQCNDLEYLTFFLNVV